MVRARTAGNGDTTPATHELARGEGQAGDRAAERIRRGALEPEARLERQAAHRGTNAVGFNADGIGRQHGLAPRSTAANLDGAHHRAVGMDAPGPSVPLEACVGEELAGNE